MKPGTIIRLPDGREGTVVYRGLEGEGIAFGRHHWDEVATKKATQAFRWNGGDVPDDYDLPVAEAYLRDPWPGCERLGMECVGEDYEVIE